MKKIIVPSVKIVDDFFEIPNLWREFALDQEYTEISQGISVSNNINNLNEILFFNIAKKLSLHCQHRNFPYLEAKFYLVNKSCSDNSIYQEASANNNLGAVIFLNPVSEKNTGISFYNYIMDKNKFQKTVNIENYFNRCVIYKADSWISHNGSFGETLDTSRLLIKINGIVQ